MPERILVVSYTEETEYRSLSTLAVVGCVLGVLSGVAWFSPLLLVLPVVALVVSVMGLRQIAANPDLYTGRPLALVGVALAVIAFTMVNANRLVTSWLIERQATAVAEEWLQRVRTEQFDAAYELSRKQPEQPDEFSSLTPKDDTPDDRHPLIRQWEIIAEFPQGEAWQSEIKQGSATVQSAAGGRWIVDLPYQFIGKSIGEAANSSGDGSSGKQIVIRCERYRSRTGEITWLVTNLGGSQAAQ